MKASVTNQLKSFSPASVAALKFSKMSYLTTTFLWEKMLELSLDLAGGFTRVRKQAVRVRKIIGSLTIPKPQVDAQEPLFFL